MTKSIKENSFVIRYLGPLVPLGLGVFGIWILISGHYSYRPGRGGRTVTLLPPDSQFAALFFISLAVLIAALGATGRLERWMFWVGVSGALIAILFVGARQIIAS